MPKAIRIHETGGPEVLLYEDFDPGAPGPGELLVSVEAAGLNFIDIYFRTGLYPTESLPTVLGKEGAGTVLAVGEGVGDFRPGDRIATWGAKGSYAERMRVDAASAVRLPDDISAEVAAAATLKGLTAQYLLRRTFAVGPDTTLLFHAAAGGVGLIAGQWAKHLGARTVIGTAGTPEKCRLALRNGYSYAIDYSDEDFVARVREITEGRGCDVVYDSVGRTTFPGSLDCLKPRGLWASFGQSSGKLPDIDLSILNRKGSLFATRPSLFGYTLTREETDAAADELFEVIRSGAVEIRIGQRYPLAEAAEAHRHLEGRATTGATILTV